VIGVEMFRKLLVPAWRATTSAVLLRGVEKTDVERGQVLAKPGSIKPHTKFQGRGLHPVEGKAGGTRRSSTGTGAVLQSGRPT